MWFMRGGNYMKRWIAIATMIICISLSGCGNSKMQNANNKEDDYSMFVLIESGYTYEVVYHKETKVMYVISHASYNSGNFVLLVNPDGTPMLYEK